MSRVTGVVISAALRADVMSYAKRYKVVYIDMPLQATARASRVAERSERGQVVYDVKKVDRKDHQPLGVICVGRGRRSEASKERLSLLQNNKRQRPKYLPLLMSAKKVEHPIHRAAKGRRAYGSAKDC